ncbi:MAG: hypothetical protein ABI563_19375 [Specibacter sp.]
MKLSIRSWAACVALVSVLGLGGCAAPPTTTYTNGAGQEVTVNWKDYPLHAYSLPGDLRQAPVKEEGGVVSARILGQIRAALTKEFDFAWESTGEPGWQPDLGNGYGGQAMTTTYNSVEWSSTTSPASTAQWQKIVRVISRITTAHGLGPVTLTHDKDTFKNDAEWQKDLVEQYGTADPQKLWWWDGTAYSGSQWLSVYLVNVDRDTTGRAAKEHQESHFPAHSVSISYGVTTVRSADLAAFEKALEPFMGLTPPEPTTSD